MRIRVAIKLWKRVRDEDYQPRGTTASKMIAARERWMKRNPGRVFLPYRPPPAPPCIKCGAVNQCSVCCKPSMIVDRCLLDYCRPPEEGPQLCAGCYVTKALAKEQENHG